VRRHLLAACLLVSVLCALAPAASARPLHGNPANDPRLLQRPIEASRYD